MTISQILYPQAIGDNSIRPLKGQAAQTASTSFDSLLNELSQSTSAIDQPSSSKPDISEMMHTITSQMNNHLIHLLLSGENDEPDIHNSGLFYRLTPPPTESSKKYTVHQNNDAFSVHENLQAIIDQAGKDNGLDPALIKSVIKVESDFNPNSTSSKGAMGLMQLMPNTAKGLSVSDPYDPAENVRAGTRYLKTLLNRYQGDLNMALTAYNWGMGNLEKRPAHIPAETRQYVQNVLRHYESSKA